MKIRATVPVLLAALAVAGCEATNLTKPEYPTKSVGVMSRTWEVVQVADTPVIYRATRDWNNLNPYGPPPRRRSVQAATAIQQATGCRVIWSTMYEKITGQFYSQVSCPPSTATGG
ncbi:hypothetical protein [Tropicibacter sp. Alg240-R139]|uniref:hypothetical protein n=1 Tax=Tropicibacter sp. Alg240-R139 TaxID=2305991 RepID=UPI0013DFD52D|nr:hypothetical protein [Tropicibacter sp. Alg240-R139]